MPHAVDPATIKALDTMPTTPAMEAARQWRRRHEETTARVIAQRERRIGLLLGMKADGISNRQISELIGEAESSVRSTFTRVKGKDVAPIAGAEFEWVAHHLDAQVAQAELKLLREAREHIISKLRADGLTIAQAAHLMGISVHTVYQVIAPRPECIAS